MPVAWDANAYEEVSRVQEEWGRKILALRAWRGDEAVLDAGCGPGVLAEDILRLVPRGRVIAVDVDPSMVENAKRRLQKHGARAQVIQADLAQLPKIDPVDVVFSNAVLHWIEDHDEVFARFNKALKPGGELLIQCGGAGNLKRVREIASQLQHEPPFEEHFRSWKEPWHYEDAESTTERLFIHGFVHADVSLVPAPVTFPDDEALRRFLKAVVLNAILRSLPVELRDRFVEECVRRMAKSGAGRTLDYVRLTIRAQRPPNRS